MMRKTLIIIALCLSSILIYKPVAAKVETPGFSENVLIGENQTINDNFVKVANDLDIRGTIQGDLIVAGASIDISGHVLGDVLAVANTIRISGNVDGDVRVAGGTIDITGKVSKNINIFAMTAELGKTAEVGGDYAAWASTINLKGVVNGKVHGGASSAVISGTVKKDVELRFDAEEKDKVTRLSLLATANIGGNLDYYCQTEAQIDKGAVVTGHTERHVPTGLGKATRKAINSFWWFSQIANLFGLFVVGLVMIWLLKERIGSITGRMGQRPGRSLLLGFAILILTPIVAILLMFTIIGIPLGIILLLLFGILIYASTVFVGIYLGQLILKAILKKKTEEVSLFWSMIIGLIIYSLVVDFILWSGSPLGVLSGFIKFIALIWVLGAIFSQEKSIINSNNAKSK